MQNMDRKKLEQGSDADQSARTSYVEAITRLLRQLGDREVREVYALLTAYIG